MSSLIVDGFDWFPPGQSSATRARLWAANNFFDLDGATFSDVVTGRFGFGYALAIDQNDLGANQHGYVVPIGTSKTTGFLGCAMYVPHSMSSDAQAGLQFYDGVADNPQVTVAFWANGVIKVYRGTNGANDGAPGVLLANTYAGAYQEDEWFHVEVKSYVASSGGTVEVRINTVPVIQVVGANTQATANTGFDSVCLRGFKALASHTIAYFDDFFVNDDSGSENNDWLGNVRVKTQFMIANGATNQFSIGGSSPAATNWQSVLNNILDDSKYVYDSNVGDIDLYTPDPNLNSPLVHSLQVRMGLRQDDATQRVGRAMLRIGGTNYPGIVDQYTNQTYTFYKERWELNPNTGVAFTGADVNGLQSGVKLQA